MPDWNKCPQCGLNQSLRPEGTCVRCKSPLERPVVPEAPPRRVVREATSPRPVVQGAAWVSPKDDETRSPSRSDVLGIFQAVQPDRWPSATSFDVYVCQDRLIAARTSPYADTEPRGLAKLSGAAIVLHWWTEARSMKQLSESRESRERKSLDQILADHPKNYSVRFDNDARFVLKRTGLTLHGPAVGRLEIYERNRQGCRTLLFKSTDAIRRCRRMVGEAAADRLQIHPKLKF